jgi:hypothetical protein
LVASCSSPPHELSTRGESKTFHVKESSDVVYRKIVEGTRTCYSKKEIAADFFPDNRTGQVSMSVKTSLNISALFTAIIKPIENGSSIQIYYLKGNPIFAEAIEEWTTGNYSKCPFS